MAWSVYTPLRCPSTAYSGLKYHQFPPVISSRVLDCSVQLPRPRARFWPGMTLVLWPWQARVTSMAGAVPTGQVDTNELATCWSVH